MNNFPAMTEAQRELEIASVKEMRSHVDFWGHASGFDAGFLMRCADAYLAMLTAEPEAWAHRLVNKHNGVVHPWVYGSAEASASEGDMFRIEVMKLFTVPPAPVLRVPDGWIKCSERMPDDYEDVIAGNSGDRNFAWWGDLGWLFPGDKVKGEITHWMPLPQPPEASNEQ